MATSFQLTATVGNTTSISYTGSDAGVAMVDGVSVATALDGSVANGLKISGFYIDIDKLKFIVMSSNYAVEIYTNNGSDAAYDDKIVLAGGVPIIWYPSGWYDGNVPGLVDPFSVDITGNIWVANSSGSTATLKIYAVQDNTP